MIKMLPQVRLRKDQLRERHALTLDIIARNSCCAHTVQNTSSLYAASCKRTSTSVPQPKANYTPSYSGLLGALLLNNLQFSLKDMQKLMHLLVQACIFIVFNMSDFLYPGLIIYQEINSRAGKYVESQAKSLKQYIQYKSRY